MNPFNWTGPNFLAFYLVLVAVCLVAQSWIRRTREAEASSGGVTPPLTDPYLVSYLAGRVNGLIRCVTVALVERNVLRVAATKKKNELVMDPETFHADVRSPLESAVARFFERPQAAHSVFSIRTQPPVLAAAEQYKKTLEAAGMMPTPEQQSVNRQQAWIVVLILTSVAGLKVFLALERGHKNVAFLVILALFASLGAGFIGRMKPTRLGSQALGDLKHLFSGLKQQAKSGSSVSAADVAFVTAVFGVAALGGSRVLYAKSLFPAAASSSGCGSGCGSSGGDSGGSSGCGGGGGCGGCGGG